ncbi:MAG: acriflavine resistance protein B [Candidatus Dadabacteria bacterium RIFCSPHIGHO2_12_FULL_53_21]|nr:MAG: acriflavine resistance protein B [Candidatus Dadabacteria bacterium RIFCSPHIGHO2_12_FULL_53_21]
MNVSGIFIRRPVMTSLIMAAILLFGIVGYRALPVSDLPNVDFPTILVSASLPGASPETMSSSVATPLERQFSTIEGIDSMTSVSALGSTQITIQFDLSRELDAAAQDVQTAISRATRLLPQDMPQPPTYRKVNPADQPILYYAVTSPSLQPWELNEYADTIMAQRISMVSGVAQVQIFGAKKYAIRIQLDPNALSSKGIGINEVEEAVNGANVNLPTGALYGPDKAYTILATGQLYNAEAYKDVIVAYRDGSPVRLSELGDIVDSIEDDKTAAWFVTKDFQERAVILAIQRQPGTNTVAVADAVKEVIPSLKSYLPPTVSLNPLYDRSQSIRESMAEVNFTMGLTLVLVVMVIFLFLRNVSATVIPSLALPLSIVGTFVAMYLFGFSLNNISMMALILAIGFVVDDAIVMLENIVRHMEMGKKPLQAALDGSKEISFTLISMTLSLAAVFIPVLLMGGVIGRLFKEFAVSICAAILISGFVSLTLTPMLCSRFLKPESAKKHGRFYNTTERFFDGMFKAYEWSLKGVLRHRFAFLMINAAILLITAYMFTIIPKGFLSNEDQGTIFTITEAPQGTSFEKMVEYQQQVADVLRDSPYVRAFFSSVGGGGAGTTGTNQGRMFMHLKPRGERPSSFEIIDELRPRLAEIPGVSAFMQDQPEIRIGGQLTKSLYQFTVQSPDIEELYKYVPLLEARMSEMPELKDVTSNLEIKNPQVNVEIMRDKASTHGVSAAEIENTLYNAYGNRWVSTIYAPTNQFQVIMELKPQYQEDMNALSRLYVKSSNDTLIPLETVARFTENVGPKTINHYGQFPAVTISFNLTSGVSLSEAVDKLDKLVAETLPGNMSTNYQGVAQEFQKSLSGLGLLLVFSILVIYLILGILYESFIHPITILSGLPSAGFGALIVLLIFGVELNVYAFVGLIMLIGIVKKNAIMQIDFALAAQRNEGKSPVEAIYQGCLIRFRPIMMTTMAALLGALPLALGHGAGAESRRPLGLTVVGGLLFSQLITLYLTPVFYIYMDRFQSYVPKLSLGRLRGKRPREDYASR